ncbi:MAG TPA: hypothetical protein VGP07_21510 [Polyangia bacterium]|jgi:hypothetical protein
MKRVHVIDEITSGIGAGLLAGVLGTAAMTLASTLEMKVRHRPASKTPAQAAEKTLDLKPASDEAEARLSNLVHWTYGTLWGLARSAISATGLRGPLAPVAHLAVVWGASLVMLPALKLAEPITRWSGGAIGADLLHHAVYAGAADATFRLVGPR